MIDSRTVVLAEERPGRAMVPWCSFHCKCLVRASDGVATRACSFVVVVVSCSEAVEDGDMSRYINHMRDAKELNLSDESVRQLVIVRLLPQADHVSLQVAEVTVCNC